MIFAKQKIDADILWWQRKWKVLIKNKKVDEKSDRNVCIYVDWRWRQPLII